MNAIAPQDKPPKVRLAFDPVIESLEDLSVGFDELAWMDSREETVNAAKDGQIRLIKAESQKELRVKVKGREVTFADRRQALLEAMNAWADDNREIVLADSGGKTRKFTHGEMAWKKQPLRIDVAEGKTVKDVLRSADKHAEHDRGFLAYFTTQLERVQLTEHITARMLMDVKLTLNKQALLAGLKSGIVRPAELRRLHLVVVDEGDKLSTRVTQYHVQSESAA